MSTPRGQALGQRRLSSLKALGGWATSDDGASALATLKIEETDLAVMLAGDGFAVVQKKLVAAAWRSHSEAFGLTRTPRRRLPARQRSRSLWSLV